MSVCKICGYSGGMPFHTCIKTKDQIIPSIDGYCWMKNLTDNGANWRIVNVFSWGHPEHAGMQRIALDCSSIFTNEALADWKGVEFHGPIHPPKHK